MRVLTRYVQTIAGAADCQAGGGWKPDAGWERRGLDEALHMGFTQDVVELEEA
jgi:hypothetical protein